MAYSEFNYKKIRTELGIDDRQKLLFEAASLVQPSDFLLKILERNAFYYFYSEKARSEGIVANVLAEVCINNSGKIALYSGPILLADKDKGLNGECDFILSKGKQSYYLDAPLFCMIEAEDNDIEKNIPQCIAQMVGARIFNENEGRVLPTIFGCVTTGSEWQFLQLEGNICWIDTKRYYLTNLSNILGVFQAIVDCFTQMSAD